MRTMFTSTRIRTMVLRLLTVFVAPAFCRAGRPDIRIRSEFAGCRAQSARAAAAAAHHWLQTSGNAVEIRRAGSPDTKRVDVGHWRQGIGTDVYGRGAGGAGSRSAIVRDRAGLRPRRAAALNPGARIVVAVLNSPPFSSEGERAMEHLVEICQAQSVRVLVLDVSESSKTVAECRPEQFG